MAVVCSVCVLLKALTMFAITLSSGAELVEMNGFGPVAVGGAGVGRAWASDVVVVLPGRNREVAVDRSSKDRSHDQLNEIGWFRSITNLDDARDL